MKKSLKSVKKRKRKYTPDELKALKEYQQLLYLKQRRKIRKRQMMFQRIRSLFKLGSVACIFLFVLYLLMIPQWKLSPFIFSNYPNNNLLIDNNLIVKDSQIINKLKQFNILDKPIFFVNPQKFEKELLKLDPIKKIYIRRYWLPARLTFTIIERQPLFLIHRDTNSSPSFALTTDATRISKDFLPLPEKFEKDVFNVIVPDLKVNWNKTTIEKYEKIARFAEKATLEELVYMDLSNPTDIKLQMSGCLIRLGEMDATIFERISRLQAIMPKVKPLEKKTEFIDLRWDRALSIKEKGAKPKTELAQQPKEPENPKDVDKNKINLTQNIQNIAASINNLTLNNQAQPANSQASELNSKPKLANDHISTDNSQSKPVINPKPVDNSQKLAVTNSKPVDNSQKPAATNSNVGSQASTTSTQVSTEKPQNTTVNSTQASTANNNQATGNKQNNNTTKPSN